MEQLNNFADNRLINGCIYCGSVADTRDHTPSKAFLEIPLPENLPVVGACRACNAGFSKDEEYVVCLIESAIAGTTDPECIKRPGVANILRRAPALRARLEAAKSSIDGVTQFAVEPDRVKNVVMKLARGHAAFELSQIRRDEPTSFWCRPKQTMSKEEWDDFDASHVTELFGEVGSRGLQRLMVTQVNLINPQTGEEETMGLLINDWVEVQDDCYRYLAIDDQDGVKIKIVIAEYLACEISWEN